MNDDRYRKRVRADFRQFYGIDLFSFFDSDEVDIKQILDLLEELPPDSRYRTDGGLTSQEHLFVDILDSLNRVHWELQYVVASNGMEPAKMKRPPKPITRPQTDWEKAHPKKQAFLSGKDLINLFSSPKTEKVLGRIKKGGQDG